MKNFQDKLRSVGMITLLSIFSIFVVGCGGSDYPVGRVSGTVTCDGAPIPGAWIYFEPLAESSTNSLVGKQGFAIADESGKFVISTYGTNDGAVIGKHKVHVTPPKNGHQCPCVFDSKDEPFLRTVNAGDNKFDLTLPKQQVVQTQTPTTLDEKEAAMEARQRELEAEAAARAGLK